MNKRKRSLRVVDVSLAAGVAREGRRVAEALAAVADRATAEATALALEEVAADEEKELGEASVDKGEEEGEEEDEEEGEGEGEEEGEGEDEEEGEGEGEEEDEEEGEEDAIEAEGVERVLLYEGLESEAEEAAVEHRRFEHHAGAIAKILPAALAQNLKYLAWSAGWAAVHARSGSKRHARLHKELFEKHAMAIARGGAEPRVGVNLGGWLLCESWMQETLFACCDGDDADEFHLCQHISSAEMAAHRATWISRHELAHIKRLGFNSVRLPVGYWVLDVDQALDGGDGGGSGAGGAAADSSRAADGGGGGGASAWRMPPAPYEGGRSWIADAKPYHGPAEEHVTRCLSLCDALGLKVNVCLHGAPGGQSGEQACGFADRYWTPQMWDVDGTVRCVEHIARKWGRHPAFDALTVINEPSDEISTEALVGFYERAYATYTHMPSPRSTAPVVCSCSCSRGSPSARLAPASRQIYGRTQAHVGDDRHARLQARLGELRRGRLPAGAFR